MANGRKTGGRVAGTPNKATADIKSLARDFGPAAIAELARMSGLTGEPGAQTEAARVACLKELLDRGYGRAALPLAADSDGSPVHYTFEWAPATPVEPPGTVAVIDAAPLQPETAGALTLVWSDDE